MGIIHHIKKEDSLGIVSRHRCIASVPFGGRYRLVDFVLSNMVNSGIGNIGVITSLKMRSLMDHLGSGKEWGLDKRHGGLYILPAACSDNSNNTRLVDLQDLYSNLDYLQRSRQKYVLISGSNMVCSLDYRAALEFHLESKADVTMIYKDDYAFYGDDQENIIFLETNKEFLVTAMKSKPPAKKKQRISMDMYLLSKEVLLEILRTCHNFGKWDLVNDVLVNHLREMKIKAFGHQGYLAVINSLPSFYRHHLALLNPAIWQELFFKHGMVYTKLKDGPPARYAGCSEVRNALVANGCRIDGTVENSVLYRNVRIGKGANIKNSIIMPKVQIEENVVLDNVILDKEVFVKKGTKLIGEKYRPVVVGKRSVI